MVRDDCLNHLHIQLVDLRYIGQQLLWTEQSGPENLDSIVWPRAAIAAEVRRHFFIKFL